jgi:hypothetical protein
MWCRYQQVRCGTPCGEFVLVESYCSWGQEQFGNPEEGERPLLEAVTRRLMKTEQAEKTEVCSLVNCKVCELVKRL